MYYIYIQQYECYKMVFVCMDPLFKFERGALARALACSLHIHTFFVLFRFVFFVIINISLSGKIKWYNQI